LLKFDEIAPGVWAFPSVGTGENSSVVLGERGALLIDLTSHPTDLDATQRFLAEMGREVRALAFTRAPDEPVSRWPGVPYIVPGTPENGVSLPDITGGWIAVSLQGNEAGRQVIYQPKDKVLFCGDMLTEMPVGIPLLRGDSQGYLDNLARVEEFGARLVVPRRGSVARGKRAIGARIESDRSYIYSLHRHVMTSLASSISLERVLSVAGQVYEDFPFLQEHLANMRFVWDELSES
jgi:glyoxylase-like metal-dependent hydrolase (beta-lactamase superfamily II)